MKVCLSMYDLFLPPGVKGLKGVLKIFKEQSHEIRSVPLAVFCEKVVLKIFGKFLENFLPQRMLKAHNYADCELCRWCFSRNFPKIFRTAISKENPMDVPYFIEEHLWMSAFNEATLKKNLVKVNPPRTWPWKQNGTTVAAAVIIFELVKNWRSVFQINILKKRKKIDFEP